jgi:rRNA maturation protein Nop10
MSRREQAFATFARFVHDVCPDPASRVVLSHLGASPDRAICGDHGRVVPTEQDLCPRCGGIVVPSIDEERFSPEVIAARERFAAYLEAI